MKGIFTAKWEDATTKFFSMLMQENIKSKNLCGSESCQLDFFGIDSVCTLDPMNITDVVFDAFPETEITRHVEPPSVL